MSAAETLDRIAREKGNSVYFPDRVEPMLPERLSNGLCSLREGENRACLAVRMVFGADGRKRVVISLTDEFQAGVPPAPAPVPE